LGSSGPSLLGGEAFTTTECHNVLTTFPKTNNVEWYDPAAIMTRNGALEVTLSRKETHGLHYEGGLMSSWNKFCFTGGLIETSVTLPGTDNVLGLWPAIWTLGNLGKFFSGNIIINPGSIMSIGRAGYGASLDGTVRQNGLPITHRLFDLYLLVAVHV
jgi:beta-glucanase (GH16 family)